MGRGRVAIGGFQHETNTFSPINAEFSDFERADGWPPLLRGDDILSATAGMNVPIAGFVDTARSCDFALEPLVWCAATPSGRVSTGVRAYLRNASHGSFPRG